MSRLRLRGALLAAALVASAAGGCGYTLQGNLPEHLKTVSVPVFKNKTTEAGAESTITAAVVNAFTSNGSGSFPLTRPTPFSKARSPATACSP